MRGGGGGQRRELNALKRLLVLDVLLILLCMKYCLVCQCGLHQRQMKAKTDRYSGLTDLLICAIFSLLPEFGPILTKNIG